MLSSTVVQLSAPPQRHADSPAAETDTGAGEVLIREEGVASQMLIWDLATEPLTQGLR